MYNPKSLKAEEFIDNQEILDTLEYAEANKDNMELIDSILEKAKERKGLSHREASVLLACDNKEKVEEMYALAEQIKKDFGNQNGNNTSNKHHKMNGSVSRDGSVIYENEYLAGDAKTNLSSAKKDFDTATTSLKNLEDEVAKLRQINAIQNTNCGFDKVNMNLADIGCGVKAILNKLYEPATTTTTTA